MQADRGHFCTPTDTHRIRRLSADDALALLRRPALTVAAGTAEAASAHVLNVAERARLVNRQIKDATRRLDALTAAIAGPEPDEDAAPGQPVEQHDATILRSLPGVGRIVLATLLAEAHHAILGRGYHALRTLRGVADRLLAAACAMLESRTAYDPCRQSMVIATQKLA